MDNRTYLVHAYLATILDLFLYMVSIFALLQFPAKPLWRPVLFFFKGSVNMYGKRSYIAQESSSSSYAFPFPIHKSRGEAPNFIFPVTSRKRERHLLPTILCFPLAFLASTSSIAALSIYGLEATVKSLFALLLLPSYIPYVRPKQGEETNEESFLAIELEREREREKDGTRWNEEEEEVKKEKSSNKV